MTLVPLGTVARFINGAAFKPADWELSGLPIIRIQNLTGTGKKFNYTNRTVKPELIVETGDLLVSWSATLDVYKWDGPKGVLNQHIFKVCPFAGVHPDYLYYALKSVLNELQHKTHGSTMKHVVRGDFENTCIYLPSQSEQRRIVDILSRAEGIVRLRREAQQKAAEIIPALFLDLFGDPATNPKGWPTALLGNISRIIGGSTLPTGEAFIGQSAGYQLLKVGDMNLPANKVYFTTSKEWASDPQKTYSCVPANSIIFPKRGAAIATNKKRITTRPALLDPNLMAVAPDEAVISHAFLYEWFCQFDLVKISSGTTIPQLNKGDLSPLVMITPPLELQSKFHELRASFVAVQEAQRQALDIAQATFDALLAQSFTSPATQQAAA